MVGGPLFKKLTHKTYLCDYEVPKEWYSTLSFTLAQLLEPQEASGGISDAPFLKIYSLALIVAFFILQASTISSTMLRKVVMWFNRDFLVTGLPKFSMLVSLKAALYPPPINRQAETKGRFIS